MYIVDGIAYAGEQNPKILISGVRVMKGYCLWLRFSTGEVKVFDFSPLLSMSAFAPLEDEKIFSSVYIDYGVTVWNDGNIDIAPELLYRDGVSITDLETA